MILRGVQTLGSRTPLHQLKLALGMTRLSLAFHLHLDPPGARCRLQLPVIGLGLIGVSDGKLAHGIVKCRTRAEVAADQPRVSRLRMGTRENPTACLGVNRQHLRIVALYGLSFTSRNCRM
jgi:hypothetical protein